jgi:hypothetical protein
MAVLTKNRRPTDDRHCDHGRQVSHRFGQPLRPPAGDDYVITDTAAHIETLTATEINSANEIDMRAITILGPACCSFQARRLRL